MRILYIRSASLVERVCRLDLLSEFYMGYVNVNHTSCWHLRSLAYTKYDCSV